MIERLFASPAPAEEVTEEVEEEDSDEMKLTSLQSITDFMTCAGRTLPDNIRLWPEETWLLPVPAKFHQKKDVMPSVLCPS